MALDPVKNFAKVEVSIGYDASATAIALVASDGAKLPQPSSDGDFNLVWWNSTDYSDPTDDPNVEIVRCTARTTDTLTVTRAQEGTSASTKNTATKTYKMVLAVTKKTIDDLNTRLEGETPTGDVDGSNQTFTVTAIPRHIVSDSSIYFEGNGYSRSGLTITMTIPPSQYIKAFV